MSKKFWINNGEIEKRVSKMIDGWNKGRLKSSTNGMIERSRINHPMQGRHHTKESRAKISNSITGENNPFYGRKFTPEMSNKLSESLRLYYRTHDGYWKGKHLSEDARSKISESASKRIGELHPRFGMHWDEDHKALLRAKTIEMLRNRPNPTQSKMELKIINYLSNYFEVIPSYQIYKGGHRYDALIKLPNGINLLFEFDGKWYHKNQDYSNDYREIDARKYGFEYLVIKELDYTKGGLKYVKERVAIFFPDLLNYHLKDINK